MRQAMRWLLAVACMTIAPGAQQGQAAFPDRPVYLVIGQAPGGSTDATARLIGAALSKKWGQPVIVQYKPGANGALAAEAVSHAPPDGYMLDLVPADHTITPNMQPLPFDPVKSFTPVTKIMDQPNVLVINPTYLKINTLKELIAEAHANPGKFNQGSGGTGTPSAMEMELLTQKTGIKVIDVPFNSGGPSIVALLGGEVQLSFASIVGTLPQIKAGKLKALAVSSNVRVPTIGDVPTVEEAAGITGFNLGTWDGLLAPPKTPPEIVNQIWKDVGAITQTQEIKDRFYQLGYITDVSSSPQAFSDFLVQDIAMWGAILKMH